jgi:hypothetical protein
LGGWRLWAHGEDTYLTATSFGHVWKVSLHGDAAWRMAVTQEHWNSPERLWTGEDRAPWKFEPVPFKDGGRMAFAIAVARGALFQGGLPSRVTPISVNDRWNHEPEPAEPPVVSALVEPMDPRTSGVNSPGLYIRGVRVIDSRAA